MRPAGVESCQENIGHEISLCEPSHIQKLRMLFPSPPESWLAAEVHDRDDHDLSVCGIHSIYDAIWKTVKSIASVCLIQLLPGAREFENSLYAAPEFMHQFAAQSGAL